MRTSASQSRITSFRRLALARVNSRPPGPSWPEGCVTRPRGTGAATSPGHARSLGSHGTPGSVAPAQEPKGDLLLSLHSPPLGGSGGVRLAAGVTVAPISSPWPRPFSSAIARELGVQGNQVRIRRTHHKWSTLLFASPIWRGSLRSGGGFNLCSADGDLTSPPECLWYGDWRLDSQRKSASDASSLSEDRVTAQTWVQFVAGFRSSSRAGGRRHYCASVGWRSLLGPSGRRGLLSVRLLVGLRERVRGPKFILLGDLRVDRRGLDARVPELFLDDLEVAPARPVQVRRVGVPT